MEQAPTKGRNGCHGKNNKGQPCGFKVKKGEKYCHLHDPKNETNSKSSGQDSTPSTRKDSTKRRGSSRQSYIPKIKKKRDTESPEPAAAEKVEGIILEEAEVEEVEQNI